MGDTERKPLAISLGGSFPFVTKGKANRVKCKLRRKIRKIESS